MTIFYSGVQNRNNKLYSHNTNNSITDEKSYSRMLTYNKGLGESEQKNYRLLKREKNEIPQEPVIIRNEIPRDNPSSPETGADKNILNHGSEYARMLFDTSTNRHRIILSRLEKIENLILLILLLLTLMLMKVFN